ncbi:3-deoxy-D-manno-octulosonic acid transferase [Campylobacter volucris]|uniref:3-deoxy-D-manno-octulosonic acid transferase n=1 Tax=Campylobacter volucris TaxID=1031542 RepID=A0AAE6CZZ4_9BACT|nr:lipid IV(A) 3-deoxy-D-manno-octulosonic acid transferase [Campylobacter volucris]AJC94277.1 3-deoxy-D-manno-octulosonic-acid transferase (KDO transferase) [Campylobacter volucris LMG 24379]KAB0580431.1 3-deoxy-D-manno-octulosonic acid transferase [Campylobacter volucris]QBL13357.1 3-deoxy-D-manno-octulosonic acid transferase [Campylobacter volucris]QEL08493.1 3-deoxy-D-manno-octulosonic-acid transferase (KDO transferase) [Campylobacter volucris]TXK70393.1 3-deoxy-D-manno-octulosonic acid tr
MIFFYYALAVILYVIAAPFLLILSFYKDKYKISLKSRFFLYKNLKQEYADLHFHGCSFGEIKSMRFLFNHFNNFRISTITNTGFSEALKYTHKVNFLPFEIFIPFWMKPCKVLVIFEAELWLILLFMAKFFNAKVILINARISDRSYFKYKKFNFFYKVLFRYIDEVFAQSLKDKERLQELGAKNVIAYKNIKIINKNKKDKKFEKLKSRLIVLASTHENEEKALLSKIKLEQNDKLVLVPRHPERFEMVEKILLDFCKINGYGMQKFSQLDLKSNDLQSVFCEKCLLLDCLGELENFYSISDIVFLCGSFEKNIGGHNPIEAAKYENIIISGKYFFNQEALYNEVENIYICQNLDEIKNILTQNLTCAKIKHQGDLTEIIQSIKEGVNAR